MTWLNSLFVIYLIGVLSPVTAQNVTPQVGETALSERQVDIPPKVRKSFSDLVSAIAQAAVASRAQSLRGESCVALECTARFDFSEHGQKRGEIQATRTVKLSENTEKKFFGSISYFLFRFFLGRRKMLAEEEEEHEKRSYCSSCGSGRAAEDQKTPTMPPINAMGKRKPKPVVQVGIPLQEPSLGIAMINSYGEGPMCTGVHLKPWILVTAGDCVSGRELQNLFVTVTMRQSDGTYYRVSADVDSITYSPGYSRKKSESNIAIVQIYGKVEWDVEPFELPRIDTSPFSIIVKHLKTYTYEWTTSNDEDYFAYTVSASVNLNYFVCKSLPFFQKWFCTESERRREVLSEMDIGCPFFYRTGEIKRLAGIYMGDHVNEVVGGYLFHRIEPHIKWLDDYVYTHPVPPALLTGNSANFFPESKNIENIFE